MSTKSRKIRVDLLLVDQGHYESRAQAQQAIMAGMVRIGDDHVVHTTSDLVTDDTVFTISSPYPYVSRGAGKLMPSLDRFLPDLTGLLGLDLGASTGGFTDLMLQRGAIRVYAVDVGHGQLHWKLRQDPRVVSLEKCNARYLSAEEIPELVDVLTGDVSFISLKLVLPAAAARLKPGAFIFVLVKPQFEAERRHIDHGVVRDEAVRAAVVADIVAFAERELGWQSLGVDPSPLLGPKGNQEFIAAFRSPSAAAIDPAP